MRFREGSTNQNQNALRNSVTLPFVSYLNTVDLGEEDLCPRRDYPKTEGLFNMYR